MQTKTDRFIQSVFVLMNTRGFLVVVPVVGLEPTRHRWQRILSPPRLPIPAHRQVIGKKALNALYNTRWTLTRIF